MIKECLNCKKEFDTKRDGNRRKYCSQECYRRHKEVIGYNTPFKKGYTPWNKNKKGIRLSPKTEFKKGQKGINWKPVGTTTKRKDKSCKERRWIKIKEPNKWQEYARYIWTKHKGEIKNGLVIHHIDGNPINDNIKNLQCLTRAEHIKIHREAGLQQERVRT